MDFYKLFCQLSNNFKEKLIGKVWLFSNIIEENKNSPRKLRQQSKDIGYKN